MILFIIILLLLFPFFIFHKPQKPSFHHPYDFLLLLGSPTANDGSLSQTQKKRCEAAIAYVRQGNIKRIIISGGAVKNEYVEANTMKAMLQKALPNISIETETKAKNTFQNLKLTKEAYGKERILIVSGPAHLRRTAFFAKKFYPLAELGSGNIHDSNLEYIKEYLRMWNALYWEVRLHIRNK